MGREHRRIDMDGKVLRTASHWCSPVFVFSGMKVPTVKGGEEALLGTWEEWDCEFELERRKQLYKVREDVYVIVRI